jgi:hypothetical protein
VEAKLLLIAITAFLLSTRVLAQDVTASAPPARTAPNQPVDRQPLGRRHLELDRRIAGERLFSAADRLGPVVPTEAAPMLLSSN